MEPENNGVKIDGGQTTGGGGGLPQDCDSDSVEFVTCVNVEQSEAVQVRVLVTVRVLVCTLLTQAEYADHAPYVRVSGPHAGLQTGGGGGGAVIVIGLEVVEA